LIIVSFGAFYYAEIGTDVIDNLYVTKSITDSVTPFKTKTRKTLILRVLRFKEVVPPGIELQI
jgi:hypothetical protein